MSAASPGVPPVVRALAFVAALALSGCGGGIDPGDPDVDLGTHRAELSTVPPANVRFDMYSGRLANTPVSTYFESPRITHASVGGAIPTFWAECADQNVAPGGGRDVSDASVFVLIRDTTGAVVDIRYDDQGSPCGFGSDKGGMVLGRTDPATYWYTVFVVSNRRNTASCTVKWARNHYPNGSLCALDTPVTLASNTQVGGTLVKVGPLPAGDTFEVQTPLNGASQAKDRTTMLLMRVGATGTDAFLWGTDASASDHDPKLTVPAGYADTAENFILLGKVGRSAIAGNEGVETRVDLLHGPLNAVVSGGTFVPGGSVGMYLTPGRWNLEVTARPALAVGDVAGGTNPSTCDSAYHRGALNRPGFNLQVDRSVAGVWSRDTSVAVRQIPLGAFGTASALQSVYVKKEIVTIGTAVRPNVTAVAGTWTWGLWSAHRNPDNSAVRFATQNMLYADNGVPDEVNEYRNAAHLFGSRGTVKPGSLSISDPTDRGPHEWDADVVVLTEGNDTPGVNTRLSAFVDEATATGSRTWVGTQQIGESVWGGIL